jgi:hypothetical protein
MPVARNLSRALAPLMAWMSLPLVVLALNACVHEPEGIVIPCDQPRVARTSPAAGATGVSPAVVVTATFNLRMDSASFVPGAFVLLLGLDTIPGTLAYAPADTAMRFVPGDSLLPDTTYTAVVSGDVRDTAGIPMGASYLWVFTTAGGGGGGGGPDTIPAIPTLLSPANAAVGVVPLATPMTWNPAARAQTYRLQVSTSPGFADPVFDVAGLTGTSQLVVGLLPLGTYYWRVNASNSAGTSDWSVVWSFSTLPSGLGL